jgi:hypothetical protein
MQFNAKTYISSVTLIPSLKPSERHLLQEFLVFKHIVN